MTQGIERIADSLGFLVFNEDGVLSSGGELENDEKMADKLMKLTQTALHVPLGGQSGSTFRRLSVMYDSFMYMITVSNHKVYVSKRRHIPQEPALA